MAHPIYATALRCRVCGEGYPLEALSACERCFGPLEVDYDYEEIRGAVSRQSIEAGPRTIWRYRALLPIASEKPVDLGVGCTPLIRAERLGRVLGLDNLYLKNDCVNPTYSFKDRVVAMAASRAVELGLDTFACASTGNLASAVAAAAAWAGLKCYVFVPADLELSDDPVIRMGYTARFDAADWVPHLVREIISAPGVDQTTAVAEFRQRIGANEGSNARNFQVGKPYGLVRLVYIDERTHYRISKTEDGRPQNVLLRRLAEDGRSYMASLLDAEGVVSRLRPFIGVRTG